MVILSANKWLGTLTNLVAYAETLDTVKTDRLMGFVNSCQDINVEYGNGKLLLSGDVLTVNDTDYDTSTLLKDVKPTVDEQYITVENYKNIPLAINQYLVKGAFVEETAMAGFVGYIISLMEKTKNIYLYEQLVNAFCTYVPTQATQTVEVTQIDIDSLTTEVEKQAARTTNSNAIYQAFMDTLVGMGAPSTEYNDLGYKQVVSDGDLKLVGNSKFFNPMLINTLATLLNSDKITNALTWDEQYILPYNQFDRDNKDTTIAWLCDKKKVQFGYLFNIATSFFDDSVLTNRYWLHFSYYLGTANALPCVKFVARTAE